MRAAAVLLACAVVAAAGAGVSPVQKVVELLDACKAKVEADLAAEATAMQEYTNYCDDELEAKGYDIKKATRSIMDLSATVEDSTATVAELEDEITGLGSTLAEKERELSAATADRNSAHETFVASEKDMVESVEELDRAVGVLKSNGGAASFLQGKGVTDLRRAVQALSTIVAANNVNSASKSKLASFVQAAQKALEAGADEAEEDPLAKAATIKQQADSSDDDDDDDDLDLHKAMSLTQMRVRSPGKEPAFASKSGSILETVEGMLDKAEDTLSELRQKETAEQQSFELIAQGMENEISSIKDRTAKASTNKATASQQLSQADEKLVATKKSKAADETYSASLKTDCETKAAEWAERQKSAGEETAAITKAKEILVSGVKEFVQIASHTRRAAWGEAARVGDSKEVRARLAKLLHTLSRKHHSFALSQLASRAKADPFVKIKGLIEEMINKLLKEASEEATHEAFCQTEMAKSKTSKEDKEDKIEKYKTRIDSSETTIAQLSTDVKTLTSEIQEIDKAQKEAVELRTKEKADYEKASKDFRESADAVARAIQVLKSFYDSATLLQVSETRTSQRAFAKAKARQPDFGGAKSDTGSSIISILEMSEEDFTTLLAEAESTEAEAVKAYNKLSQENKIAKMTKQSESKAKESEIKSLKVTLESNKEDDSVAKEELEAVLAYIDKLKPECETKAMSYAERKAAREAEIQGLKEALEILEGKAVLLQTARRLRRA